MPPELLLIRHGQSQSNVGLSTDPDSPLTELGLRQSQQVAAQLSTYDLSAFSCITSPYRRARQTAQIIAAATGVRFKVKEAVREWGPDATINGASYPEERIADVVARLRDFLIGHCAQNLLVVTHATPIALLTQLAREEPPVTTGSFWEGVENCCLRRVGLVAHSQNQIVLRQVTGDHDSPSELIGNLAQVFLEARKSHLRFLIDLHDLDEDRRFLSNVVLLENEVWIAECDGRLAGFIAFAKGWINHLYVHPDFHRRGIGTRLLEIARHSSPDLQLWVFEANTPAIRFYESRGFHVVERTGGAGNEAKLPDVRMEWKGAQSPDAKSQ